MHPQKRKMSFWWTSERSLMWQEMLYQHVRGWLIPHHCSPNDHSMRMRTQKDRWPRAMTTQHPQQVKHEGLKPHSEVLRVTAGYSAPQQFLSADCQRRIHQPRFLLTLVPTSVARSKKKHSCSTVQRASTPRLAVVCLTLYFFPLDKINIVYSMVFFSLESRKKRLLQSWL